MRRTIKHDPLRTLLGCAALLAAMSIAGCGADAIDATQDTSTPAAGTETASSAGHVYHLVTGQAEPPGPQQAPLASGAEDGVVNTSCTRHNWEIVTCRPFKFECWCTGNLGCCISSCYNKCVSECQPVCGLSARTCENSSHCGHFVINP